MWVIKLRKAMTVLLQHCIAFASDLPNYLSTVLLGDS